MLPLRTWQHGRRHAQASLQSAVFELLQQPAAAPTLRVGCRCASAAPTAHSPPPHLDFGDLCCHGGLALRLDLRLGPARAHAHTRSRAGCAPAAHDKLQGAATTPGRCTAMHAARCVLRAARVAGSHGRSRPTHLLSPSTSRKKPTSFMVVCHSAHQPVLRAARQTHNAHAREASVVVLCTCCCHCMHAHGPEHGARARHNRLTDGNRRQQQPQARHARGCGEPLLHQRCCNHLQLLLVWGQLLEALQQRCHLLRHCAVHAPPSECPPRASCSRRAALALTVHATGVPPSHTCLPVCQWM
jgi:hypothetical protein